MTWVKPLYDPVYDRLWAEIEDLDVPVNVHGGTGVPDYGPYPVSMLLYINEASFYSQRPLVQFILSGIFERFPRLQVRGHRGRLRLGARRCSSAWTGCSSGSARPGRPARSATATSTSCRARPPSTSTRTCGWASASPDPTTPPPVTQIGLDRFMWGSDYPHDEGTGPFTREHLRALFHDTDPAELQRLLAGNAAELYGFDLDGAGPAGRRRSARRWTRSPSR